MPGLCTHIYLTYQFLEQLPASKLDRNSIMAGSLAPDSAYAIPDFHWDLKKKAHLRMGIHDRDILIPEFQKIYRKNLEAFIHSTKKKKGEEYYFYLGYLIHLISDSEFVSLIRPLIIKRGLKKWNLPEHKMTKEVFYKEYRGMDSYFLKDFNPFSVCVEALRKAPVFAVEDLLTSQNILDARDWFFSNFSQGVENHEMELLTSEDLNNYYKRVMEQLNLWLKDLL